MHILITGATGLVGRKICQKLLAEGNDLTVIGRSGELSFREKFSFPCNYMTWGEIKLFSFRKKTVKKIDAVIHLAGESIADGKWTKRKKERIYNSRVESTRLLIRFLSENSLLPEVFISASAVGFYGESTNDNAFVETDVSGEGFLAEVCRDWENASEKLKNKLRLVHMRIGLVFDDKGGFLAEMDTLFSKGLGGKIASGSQWMSWVHIDDLVKIFLFSLSNEKISGPVNAVAPEPIRNKDWTQSFAKALKMPALFVVPKIALKIGLGEKSVLALQSQKVIPKKLMDLNFSFDFESTDKALANLYSWKKKATDKLFHEKIWVNQKLDSVFNFFADEKNLEKITPKQLQFNILNMSTNSIEKNTIINYKLKIRGVPANWQTRITVWDPPNKFVDNQEKGPYSKWHHTHLFSEIKGGTLMDDYVIYRLPLGFLGSFMASCFVKNDIKKIFSYRQKVIKGSFTKV